MKKLFLSGLAILCLGVTIPMSVRAQQSTTSSSASPTTQPNSQPNSRPNNNSPAASPGSTNRINSGHKRKPTAQNTVNSPHDNSSGHQ